MEPKHRCEIHVEAEDESYVPTRPCGEMAVWSSDDVQEGATVWMCEEHAREAGR